MTHLAPDIHLLSALSAGQPLRPIVVQTRLEQQGQPVSDAAARLSRLARRGLAQRHPRYGYTLTLEGEAHLHRHWPLEAPVSTTLADLLELERWLLRMPPSFSRERALERVRDLIAEQRCRTWWPSGPYRVRAPRPGER